MKNKIIIPEYFGVLLHKFTTTIVYLINYDSKFTTTE